MISSSNAINLSVKRGPGLVAGRDLLTEPFVANHDQVAAPSNASMKQALPSRTTTSCTKARSAMVTSTVKL